MERAEIKKEKRKMTSLQKDYVFAFFCILPVFLGLSIVVFAPIIKAIWMSFMEYRINSAKVPVWNHFKNYTSLLQFGNLWEYLKNTVVFIVGVVSIQFIIAMGVALLFNTGIRGVRVFRSVFMVPWTIPSVVTALLWSWLLQPQYGVLNYLSYTAGLQSGMNVLWTQDPDLAMISIIIACVWRQTPYMMLMLLAGLQSMDSALLEAAKIDGGNPWQVFRHVIIPSIRPVIDTTLVIAVINNSQMFTIIYNMTKGGPMSKTTTFAIAAYNKAFVEFDFGAGSALGVIWLVILGLSVFFYKRYSDKHLSSYM